MKYRITFTRPCETEDSFDVEGDTLEEVKSKTREFFRVRNLDPGKCGSWSREIKEAPDANTEEAPDA